MNKNENMPWMNFYKDYPIERQNYVDLNIKKYLENIARNKKDLTAETYYGKETSYGELFYNVDKASRVLTEMGVGVGDRILYLVPNIPEVGELWLGSAQIGAVSDFIDPRPDSMDAKANGNKLLEIVKFEHPKYIVALDMCYMAMIKPVEEELLSYGIHDVVLLRATDSMNLGGKISYMKDVINYNDLKNKRHVLDNINKLKWYQALLEKVQMMKQQEGTLNDAMASSKLNIMFYDDLKRNVQNSRFTVYRNLDGLQYIGHTSGTSGTRPKPIPGTHKNAISTLEQLKQGLVNFDEGDTALHVLPFFAPFGAYNNYLMNLTSLANNIDVPEFEISEFGYLIKKYHPNVIMISPSLLHSLTTCDYLEGEDLSCVKVAIYGGDTMTAKDEEELNKFFRKHGSSCTVTKGYGMSEFFGCGSYAQGAYNDYECIGIPLPHTDFTLVDPNIEDRLVRVPINHNGRTFGELVVSGDNVTKGVLDENVIIPQYELDGKTYIRTRDLVEMDEEGKFYHKSRKDRSFARFDGYKIKPYEVEKEIAKNEKVKYVCIVEYFDEKRRGLMPACHIVLNDDYKNEDYISVVNDIVYNDILANKDMSSRQIPSKFKFRTSMPQTKNGKMDFVSLRKDDLTDDDIVNVVVAETNLSTSTIDIYQNKSNDLVRKRK